MKIKIIKCPPGFPPASIRNQWHNIEIPVHEDQSQRGVWTGKENAGGYVVKTADAIDALRTAGRCEAAKYWSDILEDIGDLLRFDRDCCEVLD